MKLIKDLNREELIEVVAVVSLRILAFDFAISAFRHLYHFSHYMSPDGITSKTALPSLTSYTAKGFFMDISYDTLMAALLFLLTVPLARLLCRGLSQAVEAKLQE